MSVLAGLARLDGARMAATGSTGAAALQRMAARFGSRAPDGATHWCGDVAGFVYGKLAITPESETELQPLCADGVTITFDGRLDNRDELADTLGTDRAASDAVLGLHAYLKWRESTAAHLLGDFALAVWDAGTRSLYAARDVSGVRPLLYRVGPGWIAWASEIDILAAGVADVPAPNEGMAGEYLTGIITSRHETLFRDIYRLPPAHALVASDAGIRTFSYWTPDPRAELRYRTDAEYEAHLSDLLTRAVSARLRTSRPAGVMLSGGVDSSSVTMTGVRVCRSGAVACRELRAFSMSDPGPADEREYFDAVTGVLRIPSDVVVAGRPRRGQFREEISRTLEAQTFPQAPALDPVRDAVRSRGARALLTGVGGDDWLGTSPWALSDLLRRGRIAPLVRRMLREARDDDFAGWPFTMKSAVWPLMPPAAQTIVRRALRRGRVPDWIDPAFAARVDLRDRLAAGRIDEIRFDGREQMDIWRSGRNGIRIHALETTARGASRFGIEVWHPFLDRRIVEFGLALPADQRWRDGRHKDLLRRVVAPSLPPAIVNRLASPSGGHALIQALDAELPAGGEPRVPACESLGWVRGAALRSIFDRARRLYRSGDDSYVWPAWNVWNAVAMDLWLNALSVVQ